jgi:hypothetical protein
MDTPDDAALDDEMREIVAYMRKAETRSDFSWWGPMFKSLTHEQDDGTIRHGGIWSSEAEDLHGHIVPQKMMEDSYWALNRFGKFNFDHGLHNEPQRKIPVGDVLEIGPITPAEALAEYGVTITGTGSRVMGNCYAIPPEPDKAPQDLLDSRSLLLGGARLGYSADGLIRPGLRSPQVRGVIATQIAIAPQPIQMEASCCYMAKSLADGMGWLEDHPKDETPGAPMARVVIVSRGVSEMEKAINAEGYLVDVPEPTTAEEVVHVGRKVFDMMVRRLAIAGMEKGYVKPHTRKTASGKVAQVAGYNDTRRTRGSRSAFSAIGNYHEPTSEHQKDWQEKVRANIAANKEADAGATGKPVKDWTFEDSLKWHKTDIGERVVEATREFLAPLDNVTMRRLRQSDDEDAVLRYAFEQWEKAGRPMKKSLSAGSGVDAATFTSGRALTPEQLSPGVKKEVPGGVKGHKPSCTCAKCIVKRKHKMEKSRAKAGSGERFKEVEESAKESGAKDPAAVAAAIGRKKYGKAKFQEIAAKGRARRMEKSQVKAHTRTVAGKVVQVAAHSDKRTKRPRTASSTQTVPGLQVPNFIAEVCT